MKRIVQTSLLALTLGLGAGWTAMAQQLPVIEAERTATFGSAPAFTSADSLTLYMYDTGYVGGIVNAPLQSVEMLHFDAPVEEVWEWVTSGNDEWTLTIETLTWDHSASCRAGRARGWVGAPLRFQRWSGRCLRACFGGRGEPPCSPTTSILNAATFRCRSATLR